jgi:hypothetical protein
LGFFMSMIGLMAVLAMAAPSAEAVSAPSQEDCTPRLAISTASPFWASYADYLLHELSVDTSFQNLTECASCSISITDIITDNGVVTVTPMPLVLGKPPLASSTSITVKFLIPAGINRFHLSPRAVCETHPSTTVDSQPTNLAVDPDLAYANDGCPDGPVPDISPLPLPEEQSYTPRRFTLTLTNEDGTPAAGRPVKWSLSNEISFRILESSVITGADGKAYAMVSPPLYFVCIAPYFDHDVTHLEAHSDNEVSEAVFAYTRCAPIGATPPWVDELSL